jgi:hypothetical protein
MERFEGFEQWLPRAEQARSSAGWNVRDDVRAQWFEALYDSPVLFSGLLDEAGRVIEANHLSVEGCGFDRLETMGRPFWDCGWWRADAALAERIRDWCTASMATGQSLSAITRYHRGDGSIAMVELGLVPVIDFDAPGAPVSHIVATGLDISVLLATQAAREDRLAADTEASREAERRFRAPLDLSPLGPVAVPLKVTLPVTVFPPDGAAMVIPVGVAPPSTAQGPLLLLVIPRIRK